ncbi:hypothetical protein PR202_ga31365 [Eleusine coracana subsp. coracana]|uniref:Uncharacterized protein n=1 Tax=Eleusine coracana subsp. coracana TaxID=191504 RepID=A0AAV5DSG8_ELECO|nr:hypothetical protein PR202_ga31365 [Eleusine coracana subsp. coracana]
MQDHLDRLAFSAIRTENRDVVRGQGNNRFQLADIERAKKTSFNTLSHIFRDYKSHLNCNYVNKNRTPFDKYGHISQQDWDLFIAQKTSSEAKNLSERMLLLNKQNKYKPRLGPGGYRKKILIWREMKEKNRMTRKSREVVRLEEHARNWIYALSEITNEGEIIVKDPDTKEVVQALTGKDWKVTNLNPMLINQGAINPQINMADPMYKDKTPEEMKKMQEDLAIGARFQVNGVDFAVNSERIEHKLGTWGRTIGRPGEFKDDPHHTHGEARSMGSFMVEPQNHGVDPDGRVDQVKGNRVSVQV